MLSERTRPEDSTSIPFSIFTIGTADFSDRITASIKRWGSNRIVSVNRLDKINVDSVDRTRVLIIECALLDNYSAREAADLFSRMSKSTTLVVGDAACTKRYEGILGNQIDYFCLEESFRNDCAEWLRFLDSASNLRHLRTLLKPFVGPAATKYSLSLSETRVLYKICAGYTDQQVAFCLGLAESTVKVHLKSIRAKMGVESSKHLLLCVMQEPLLDGKR